MVSKRTTMSAIIFLVIVSLLNAVTAYNISELIYEENDWLDYIEHEIEIDDYDASKAVTAVDDTAKVLDKITAQYNERKHIKKEEPGEAPLVSLIYSNKQIKKKGRNFVWAEDFQVGSVCGGAILTVNVMLTLCACIQTLLWKLDKVKNKNSKLTNLAPPWTNEYDLGGTHLYVWPFGEHIDYEEVGVYSQKFVYYSAFFDKTPEYDQFANGRCVALMARYQVNLDSFGKKRLTRALLSSMALVKFAPDLTVVLPDWFIPWPPYVMSYDKQLVGSPYKNGLSSSRNLESITIFSYGFKPWRNTTAFINSTGDPIDIFHSLMAFRTGLCHQTYCKTAQDYYSLIDLDNLMDVSSIGCFCDQNDADTICGGVVGTPALSKGILYGLLLEPIGCNTDSPRGVMVRGFDRHTESVITGKVPALQRRMMDADVVLFRDDSSLVMDYNVVFPLPGMLPNISKDFEIDYEEVGGIIDLQEAQSSSTISRPFILTVFYLVSIDLMVHHLKYCR